MIARASAAPELPARYLGVDNSQNNVLRLVCVEPVGPRYPRPVWWKRVTTIEALHHAIQLPAPTFAGITRLKHDPFGGVKWLRSVASSVGSFGPADEPWFIDDLVGFVPKPFRRAYALAHCAAHRDGASVMLHDLHVLTLRLRAEVSSLQQEVWALSQSLPVEVPF